MLQNGKVGTVTVCGGVLFQKSKYEMTKITDRTLIKLS